MEETLTLFGVGAIFILLVPFAVFRFIIEDYVFAGLDCVVMLALIGIFVQTLREKKIKHLKFIIVIFFKCAVLVVTYLRTSEMIFWAYPAIIVSYFLLAPLIAAIINSVFIASVIVITLVIEPTQIGFYPTLILVGVFGYVFSVSTDTQNKELTKLATEDTLTKINNRRSFDVKVEEILVQNSRSPVSVSLLLFDLDFFKKINDSHGHKRGDKVLFYFAQTVKSVIRNTDFIYRFGGEEFAVITTNSELESSGKFADSIREIVQHTPKLCKYDVTVSIGVSQIMAADDADSWFRRADLALYESKFQGRNRVYLAETDRGDEVSFRLVKNKANLRVYPSTSSNLKQLEPKGPYGLDLKKDSESNVTNQPCD